MFKAGERVVFVNPEKVVDKSMIIPKHLEIVTIQSYFRQMWGCDFYYIKETLDSILSQSFKEFEVVIYGNYNDKEVPIHDQRVHVYYEPINQGLGHNLNEGYLHATGDIVVFMSANDIMLPGALQDIWNSFQMFKEIGIVVRPYYFFNNNWHRPIRVTKSNNLSQSDLIALCGQMSGIGVRKSCMLRPFSNNTFVEFVSAMIPILNQYDYGFIHEPNVAIRNEGGGSYNPKVYEQSPTLNWIEVCKDNVEWAKEICGRNYVGLIQVKGYGGMWKFVKEVWYMIRLEPINLLSPKFWLYIIPLLLIPASLIRWMVNVWWRTR